ncbi:TetR/AcrR family transcriptional regulator [Dyadobacter sp. CY345]|uniref:TetR/AcrR family transcriptional regulator n=1 Tax=Dyadobacter sp. CY345 TaxID=2909335 RepID=UPI001F43E391|nr:TetR/AcrR family transcriptional regulator [Dyadobacter sp. CY345]MCF2442737.1 TetR/AcrR family transcriptional regulator [Dyadobacter sp. CY345]
MKHNPILPKERILETALHLFHKQGYRATGINQIISDAGVAKASLYFHYKSKEELGIEYLNARQDVWFSQLKLFTDESKKPKKKILAAFDFLVFMNEKENFRGCSFLNMLSEIQPDDNKLLASIQQHKIQLREFFQEILMEEKADHTDIIYLLFESAMTESQLFKDQWPVEKAKQVVSDLFKLKYIK